MSERRLAVLSVVISLAIIIGVTIYGTFLT